MTDETPKKRTRRRPAPAGGTTPASDSAAPGAGSPDEPDAALERLASMGSDEAVRPAALPPTPAVSSYSSPPPGQPARPVESTQRTPRARPRPAGRASSNRITARVAAPVVFLIAVIALVGIVVQSGVMNDSGEPTSKPTPNATKSTSVTKKYVVKSGDSWSSIAQRFNTSVGELRALNPDLSASTLVVGVRIVVPRQ